MSYWSQLLFLDATLFSSGGAFVVSVSALLVRLLRIKTCTVKAVHTDKHHWELLSITKKVLKYRHLQEFA